MLDVERAAREPPADEFLHLLQGNHSYSPVQVVTVATSALSKQSEARIGPLVRGFRPRIESGAGSPPE